MTILQALILGIVQGLTEFLPVSSSTHLNIAKHLMGLPESEWMVYFDLLCHLGTLLAIIAVLWKEVWGVLTSLRSIALFSLALLPLVPAYFLFKPLRVMFADDAGFFLICTGAFMVFASRPVLQTASAAECQATAPMTPKWRDVLWIGIAQSMALIPGISRSASTISTARLCGWEWKEAARFSFLLAIPTVLGGSALETIRSKEITSVPWPECAIGFGASFIVGLGAIRLLFWMLNRGNLRPFAWYCMAIGLISLVWLR
jgi:undecaprenyl-diphosphatase